MSAHGVTVNLTDVCDFQGGTQPPKETFIYQPRDGYIRLLQIQDFAREDRAVFIPRTRTLKTCNDDDVLIARYGASLGRILTGLSGAYNVAIVKTVPDVSRLSKPFLFHLLNSRDFQDFLLSVGSRAAQAGFNKDDLSRFQFVLPPLSEQKRIAGILDQASGLRRKRQQALALTDQFLRSTFLDLFGDPVTNPKHWKRLPIGDIAEVQGGLQVTSKRAGNPVEVPYLRVANVHRERLDLSEIKTMQVTDAERDRIALQLDDILVVEGHGNRDEIGRCAVWDGSIEPCIHQNHLIRVRVNRELALPQYISAFINSPGGRRQLFQSSNTTSGLNTISTSTIRETVALLPPRAEQQRFVDAMRQVEQLKTRITTSETASDSLFDALVQRAFRGEL